MKLTITKENYCGTVVQIGETYPLKDCDNVVGTKFFTNQVVVPKDTPKGEVGVYFPAGCKLSDDFIKYNNLSRYPELNVDGEKKGYFEKNNRVKAVLFRKHESNGFYMPLHCLAYLNVDLSKLKIGDRFNEINDVEIVTKYLPTKGKASNAASSLETLGVVDGEFELHRDTKHFAQNVNALTLESEISVTIKMHGCLPAKQTITMADGTLKKIKDVKVGDYVLGYDHSKNQAVSTKVLNTFINGKTKEWVKITKKSVINNNGKIKKNLVVTKNHKLYVKNKGYIDFSQYCIGDVIFSQRLDYNLDEIRKSILTGILLGDGYLDVHNATKWAISYGHKIDHECYIDYINQVLSNFSTQHKRIRISGYGTTMIDSRTKHSNTINTNFNDWLVNGKKIIPNNLVLDKYVLAFWYMDDGNLGHTGLQEDRVNFAICGFNDLDCQNLNLALKAYGFNNYTFYKDSKGYNRLRLNASDAKKLFNDICHLMPDCMQYKLPKEYRNKFVNYTLDECIMTNYVEESILEKIEVVSSDYIGRFTKKYDIETDTHNFFAGDILVHNSSAVVSKVLANRKLSLIEKIKKFFGFAVQTQHYIGLAASRGVIKDPMNFDGFDLWVDNANKILPFIGNGTSVYGEIVGFYPDGKLIQKNYDYGCENGNYDFYVYRVVHVGESGHRTEIPLSQFKLYFKNDPKIVPIRFQGLAIDLAKEFGCNPQTDEELQQCILNGLKNEIEVFEPLCKNKVPREGYVIRIENSPSKPALKLKSFLFTKWEDEQMDKGEVDVETEQSV